MRVALEVPLKAQYQVSAEETVSCHAVTQKLSADGALMLLDAPLVPGQPVILTNKITHESVKCFVTSVRELGEARKHVQRLVGVGFALPNTNFWHISFPRAGTRQAIRSIRTGELISSPEIEPYRRFGT